MKRVLITGSTTGLGAGAARELLDLGHEVVLHARREARAASFGDLASQATGIVVGDLSSGDETRSVAEQANAIGGIDAVIHNAGVEARSQVLAVNVVAPYVLTALIDGPSRHVYLSSSMHSGGRADLTGIDWSGRHASRSYSDSKLYVTTLAAAVARLCTGVLSNSVDPGWVPTRMGGRGAPDDLRLGHLTQVWLATSDDPEARTSGGYWHHQRRADPPLTFTTSDSRTSYLRSWRATPARLSSGSSSEDVRGTATRWAERHRRPPSLFIN